MIHKSTMDESQRAWFTLAWSALARRKCSSSQYYLVRDGDFLECLHGSVALHDRRPIVASLTREDVEAVMISHALVSGVPIRDSVSENVARKAARVLTYIYGINDLEPDVLRMVQAACGDRYYLREFRSGGLRKQVSGRKRPPKKWWYSCVEKAKSFADDPDRFCGGLWYHPENFVGGEKMRESFGKEGSVGLRTFFKKVYPRILNAILRRLSDIDDEEDTYGPSGGIHDEAFQAGQEAGKEVIRNLAPLVSQIEKYCESEIYDGQVVVDFQIWGELPCSEDEADEALEGLREGIEKGVSAELVRTGIDAFTDEDYEIEESYGRDGVAYVGRAYYWRRRGRDFLVEGADSRAADAIRKIMSSSPVQVVGLTVGGISE